MDDVLELRGIRERLVVDTSEGRPVHLVVGRSGAYMRLSPTAFELLRGVAAGLSFEEIASGWPGTPEQRPSTAALREAFSRVLERMREIEARPRRDLLHWIRVPLLSPSLVRAIAGHFVGAYRPFVAAVIVGVIAGSLALALPRVWAHPFTAEALFAGYALFIVALAAHELGHASACRRFGVEPSEIGFTLYLIYPAFYSNVTAAWELPRLQRVVVDLAGAYFQLVIASIYAIAFWWTGAASLAVATALNVLGVAFSLNPFMKFDGYWVVADALGVTNLGKQPARILRHLASRARGRAVAALPWPRTVIAALGAYTAASFAVWAFFIVAVAPLLTTRLLAYPALLARLASRAATASIDRGDLTELAAGTFIAVIAVLVLLRVATLLGALARMLGRRLRAMALARSAPAVEPNERGR